MGYRIQHNNAIGPYKGGLRFHASVNLSVLKFLAFRQLSNSLTTLPYGAVLRVFSFSPSVEQCRVIRFTCQAFMTELFRHIGPDEDVPADIGARRSK